MNNVAMNPTQLHLLKMFSYAKTEDTLFEIKKALTAYFAQKVEDDMDRLWDNTISKDKYGHCFECHSGTYKYSVCRVYKYLFPSSSDRTRQGR